MIQAEEAERNRRYEAAKEEITQLADDDVEDVVGGVYRYVYIETRPLGQGGGGRERVEGCAWDFTDTNCYFKDACNKAVVKYYGCSSRYHQE